jgi:Family of unknown function (DUF6535)
VTVLDLKPNPQDTSAFYLQNIYQLQALADPNISSPLISSTLAQPKPFSPPNYAVWVNSLWFLSLVISLTCAMLATLLQQWARRYLRITQPPRYSPHDRARIRAFYADGVDRLHLSWAVGTLPTMIHLSLFLFFAGLLIYLFNINHSVFLAVVWWVGLSAVAYLAITFMPTFRLDTPYYTPLTSIVGLLWHMERMAEKKVQNLASKIDGQVLKWIFDTVVEDHELAQFFESILGFCGSSKVKNPLHSLTNLGEGMLPSALTKFLERTWSSNFVSDSDKMQRLVVCVKVADVVRLPDVTLSVLKDIFPWDRHKVLRSVEMGKSLRRRGNRNQQEIGLCAQSIVAGIISNVQGRDDRWTTLAADQLRKSEGDIRRYHGHGNNSVLLANLAYITRQIFHSALGDDQSRAMADVSSYILPTLSSFNIRNTLPELQEEFRALWDEIVENVQIAPDNRVLTEIRDNLLNLYNALSQGDDDALTSPTSSDSNPSAHPPGSTSPIDEAIDENTHTHTTTPQPVFRHDVDPPIVPHSFLRAPGHTTTGSADQSSPSDGPDATQHITPVAASRRSASLPLESHHSLGGVSQEIAVAASATQDHTAGITPTPRFIRRLNPTRVPPAEAHSPTDSAMIRSVYISQGLESPSPASTSVSSPATPQVASVLDPYVTSIPTLAVHDDAHGPVDPSQMELPHHALQSDPTAENRDPSDNPP